MSRRAASFYRWSMTNVPAPQPQPAVIPATNVLGILSLVGGALAIVFGHTIVIPIAAIVLGFVARHREPRPHTLANWGIALGFVSLFGWIVIGIVAAAAALPFIVGSAVWMH